MAFLGANIEDEQLNFVKRVAKEDDRSLSSVIRALIQKLMEEK